MLNSPLRCLERSRFKTINPMVARFWRYSDYRSCKQTEPGVGKIKKEQVNCTLLAHSGSSHPRYACNRNRSIRYEKTPALHFIFRTTKMEAKYLYILHNTMTDCIHIFNKKTTASWRIDDKGERTRNYACSLPNLLCVGVIRRPYNSLHKAFTHQFHIFVRDLLVYFSMVTFLHHRRNNCLQTYSFHPYKWWSSHKGILQQ